MSLIRRITCAAAAAALTLLVAGLAGTSYGLVEANRQRALAQDRATEAIDARARAEDAQSRMTFASQFNRETIKGSSLFCIYYIRATNTMWASPGSSDRSLLLRPQ